MSPFEKVITGLCIAGYLYLLWCVINQNGKY